MPVILHPKNITYADCTDSDKLRPSDWNSSHNQQWTLQGNTLGASTLSGTNIQLSGGANITLSVNGQTIGIVGMSGGGLALSASDSLFSSGTVVLTGARNVTIGTGAGTIIVSGPDLAAYLTTAALSNHSHGNPSLALTNLSGTTASASWGLTLSLSAAAPAGGIALQGGTVTITSGTAILTGTQNVTITANGQTISISGPDLTPYLTTAMVSNEAHIRALVGSNTTYTSGTVILSGSRNITVGSAAGQIVITGPDLTPYLTTAAASNHSHGNPSLALTNLSGTTASNSAGLTISLSASTYLTTAALSNHSHGNPSLALTNLSGTTASNSGGLTISLSAAAPGGGAAGTNTFSADGLSSITGTGLQIVFSNVTNVTLLQTTAANAMTLGFSGNAAGGGGAGATHTMWFPYNEAVNVIGSRGQGSIAIAPVPVPGADPSDELHIDRVVLPLYFSNASNSTGSITLSMALGLYTRNASSLSLAYSASSTLTITYQGNNSSATWRGIRLFSFGWTTTITGQRFWAAVWSRTTTGGTNASLSQALVSGLGSNLSGYFGVANNASYQWPLGQGDYTSTTTALPAVIPFASIIGTGSLAARPPSWHMISGSA